MDYDAVIAGGGLAGLTLARQLEPLEGCRVLVVEPTRALGDPIPRVGESTVEVGAHYLRHLARCGPMLERGHWTKMGLRFFFGGGGIPFAERPEFGQSKLPETPSYQIDRGLFERELRETLRDSSVEIREGARVADVALGDDAHRVTVETRNGPGSTVRGRWLVDASGRRRLLARKLGLARRSPHRESAAWWWVRGSLDVADLVDRHSHRAWHQRVPGNDRYRSTIHLVGDGYWVWVIALRSGWTSVGIVAHGDTHPFETFNTRLAAAQWLESHEPELARVCRTYEPVGFRVQGRYTTGTTRVMSPQRWSCLGDAGQFPDPLYSPGTDLIGFSNSMTANAIALDRRACLPVGLIDYCDTFLRAQADGITRVTKEFYAMRGRPVPIACKLLWDFVAGWATNGAAMFGGSFLDPSAFARSVAPMRDFTRLSDAMQRLFVRWATTVPGRHRFDFIDYLAVPFVEAVRSRSLRRGRTPDELAADASDAMAVMRALAAAIERLAARDGLGMGAREPGQSSEVDTQLSALFRESVIGCAR